jgi:hypothetical protein
MAVDNEWMISLTLLMEIDAFALMYFFRSPPFMYSITANDSTYKYMRIVLKKVVQLHNVGVLTHFENFDFSSDAQ